MLTKTEIEKLITHCENMIELCDVSEEREVWTTMMDKLVKMYKDLN